MASVKRILAILALLFACGCGNTMDDLHPSGNDQRPLVQPEGSTAVGQTAPDFTALDLNGHSFNLYSALAGTGVKGAVLYFTMWCSTCNGHMAEMQTTIASGYPDVIFLAVDYTALSVADTQSSVATYLTVYGFSGTPFVALADIDNTILNSYGATMATTVVIDRSRVIRMNEQFKDTRLSAVLDKL